MSTSSKLTISLDKQQLAKLTNATPEIRMRAFEQVETRFIRCLQLGETIDLKPVLLLKQLIRWFSFTPPVAAERVLSLMLELLRSDYVDAIVQKITCLRLLSELEKISRIVESQKSRCVNELLNDLQSLVTCIFNDTNSVGGSNRTTSTSEFSSSDIEFSIDRFRLSPTDYEKAWTRASLDDLATMKTIVDSLTNEDEMDLIDNLTILQIKLCDYPVEYFLQTPHIFLQLLHMQRMHSSQVFLHINRSIYTIIKLLQRGLCIRSGTVYYSASIESQESSAQQLRIPSALTLLLNACIDLLGPPTLEDCRNNWHIMEIIVEVIKTFTQLSAPIPIKVMDQVGLIVQTLIKYHGRFMYGTPSDLPSMTSDMMIPRLESVLFDVLLIDIVSLNAKVNPKIDKKEAQSMLQTIMSDCGYVFCAPMRKRELILLIDSLINGKQAERHQLARLENAYSLAIKQLASKTRLSPKALLLEQRQVCLVLIQLGSEKLVKQLCQAIVKCTSFYGVEPELRLEAESLFSTLIDLQDERLRGIALRHLRQPVVDHFHAFLNKSNYMTGCSNIELARKQIFGLPMTAHLFRKLLVQGWMPNHSQTAQLQMQQWCIDYLIMLLGLAKLIDQKDFNELFQIVIPVLPLIVCRAISYPQLEQLLFELVNPDANYLDAFQAMRVNACYLYHPNVKTRQEAQSRVAYTLIKHDQQNRYREMPDQMNLALMGPDLFIVRPPMDYSKFFSEGMNPTFMANLQALYRLLETPDLKPAIRKSSFVQLNVLLQNWEAVEAFTKLNDVLCLKAIHDPLLRDKSTDSSSGTDTLQAAVSILLKVFFRNGECRKEFKDDVDILHCLLRNVYLHPLEVKMRAELSICIFQLLFDDHITASKEKFLMNVDMSALMVPLTFEINHRTPPSAATDGIALQDYLLSKYFGGNYGLAAQYWRIYVASIICGSTEEIKLSALQGFDTVETLRLKTADLALVQASFFNVQLQNLLTETSNCSNHEMMHMHLSCIQMFLLLLRDQVPQTLSNNLWKIMHKYLKLPPTNGADLEMYISLMYLCINCLRYKLPRVPMGLFTALETDNHHSFYVILRNLESPLELMHLVSDCVVQLLTGNKHQADFSWCGKLFMELSTLARSHFEKRNLQHVRCLLRILSKLSGGPLQLSDDKLQTYYQHFVQLSSNLRTSTQTGAQWQRDCLMVICQLQDQAQDPFAIGSKSGAGTRVVRYLLGLCGHSDGEVRALSWVALANWIKSRGNNMICVLTEFLNFLPGGLAACCLSTMMDGHEQMLVREMAGRVFIMLMPHFGAAANCELLNIHSFLNEAHKALGAVRMHPNLTAETEPAGTQNSCEIIGCYVSICINQVMLQPSWCTALCESSFFNALSNVMKLKKPAAPQHERAFLELCAGEICNMYAICYSQNFLFLQRTICRDSALLKGFVTLIRDVFEQETIPDHQLIHILKLQMVFCKDENAYEFLCEQFQANPDLFVTLVLYGLKTVYFKRDVQRYSLALLTLLLSKAEIGKHSHHSLLKVLESKVDRRLVMIGSKFKDEESNPDSDKDSNDKENNLNAFNNLSLTQKKKPLAKRSKEASNSTEVIKGTVFLYNALDQLFQLHYPLKGYSFLQSPSRSHTQICKVFANLLKLSPVVAENAQDFKLLDYVIQLLETFLDDGNVGNATVYVRRVGAHKSQDIINNLLLLFHMLMHWHSGVQSVITDPVMASRVVRVLLRVWPWLSHSPILKYMTVLLTTLLTEHSFEMCKQTSQMLSGQSHSLLQLMVRVADHESTKKELTGANKNLTVESPIEGALRVMINCCSCAEGRVSLGKMRVLDMFDTILPATSSSVKKVKPDIVANWLTFWEVFSRYELGNKICHLQALINTVRNSPFTKMRQCSLRILRNMCFCNSNRAQLVALTDFVNLLSDIASQPVRGFSADGTLESFEEHNLAVLCVWKLFGFNAKSRAELRRSNLYTKFTNLSEQLTTVQTKNPQLFKTVPFALDLSQKLANLFKAVNR